MTFPENHLWGGARRNQRMKSADRAAGDGDEAKRKNLTCKNWPRSVDESCQRRHHDLRPDKQNPRRKRKNGPRLDERAQIIAGREQQPHGKNSSSKTVRDDQERQRNAPERERNRPR